MAGITTYTPPPKFVGDVFGLTSVYERQVKNIESGNLSYWNEGATYGYYGGGGASGISIGTGVNRLDFFTESFSLPSYNITYLRGNLTATSSNSYGYYGGGSQISSTHCIIQRLDFSNETVSNPGKDFLTSKYSLSATKNNSYGYFGGGTSGPIPAPTGIISTITRLDFSTENVTDLTVFLPAAREDPASVSTDSYGYYGGGTPPTVGNLISRFDFSSETISNPTKNFSANRADWSAVSNKYYGYFGGGNSTIISRIDFSTENVNDIGNTLNSVRPGVSASSSLSNGYFVGGSTSGGSIISRLNFSTETVSNLTNTLDLVDSDAFSGGASVSKNSINKTYGYFAGGVYPNPLAPPPVLTYSLVDRLNFSTETTSQTSSSLSLAKRDFASVSNNYYGYFGGGRTSPEAVLTLTSNIDRIDFLNETISTLDNKLPSARSLLEGTSSNSYGYFGGGNDTLSPPSGILSIISRLDFSSETSVNIPTKFPAERQQSAAISNSSYGYFGGGNGPSVAFPPFGYACTITRLDFSNETINNLPTALPSARYEFAATSSNSYGYFGGGTSIPSGFISNISRFDFSTETCRFSDTSLPGVRGRLAATSSSSFGYFGGGDNGSFLSSIVRLNFSTETVSILPSVLSMARSNLSAVSNSN